MKELWCLHVLGPDDVHAAPTRQEAERAASELNEWMDRVFGNSPVRATGIAAIWPHSDESHAEDLANWEELWGQPPSTT